MSITTARIEGRRVVMLAYFLTYYFTSVNSYLILLYTKLQDYLMIEKFFRQSV